MPANESELLAMFQRNEPTSMSEEQINEVEALLARHPRVQAWPQGNHKTVHFIRHAEALHNRAFRVRGRIAYTDPGFLDPELTELGKQQCYDLKPLVDEKVDKIDLVIVSPLRRTLQTAFLAVDQREGVPWLAHESVRERLGRNTCDKRRSITEAKAEYPMVDFSHISDEEDQLWVADHRETPLEMAQRGIDFLAWLEGRPESNIAIVSHSAFLLSLFNQVLACPEELREWFENCEMRTVVLQF